MKSLSDNTVMRWGAYAGVVAGISLVALLVLPQQTSSRALDVFILCTNALAVVYWYGLSIVGTRYKSPLLHWSAIVALVGSILYDVTNTLFTLFSTTFVLAWNGENIVGGLLGLLVAAGYILAGYAVLQLKKSFGVAAQAYGVLSLLAGALFLFGLVNVYSSYMDAALYMLGSIILLRSVR